METRGAFGFKLDGKYFVTYNHFDSYPEGGFGGEVVFFCQYMNNHNLWDVLKERVKNLKLVNSEDIVPPELIEKYREFFNANVSSGTTTEWYDLLRNIQGSPTLWHIFEGTVEHMPDNFNFMKDSLLCEYGYIINLDTMQLDFYEGFNKSGKANNLPFEMKADDGYWPVSLEESYAFDSLPLSWIPELFKRNE